MDEFKVRNLITEIESLSYSGKKNLYQHTFSMGYFASTNMNDRMILISLVALTSKKMREKDATMTPLKVLLKITGYIPDNSSYYHFLEALAIIVEDFSYGIETIDSCGMKTSQEVINKIKELLGTWLPF